MYTYQCVCDFCSHLMVLRAVVAAREAGRVNRTQQQQGKDDSNNSLFYTLSELLLNNNVN